MKEQNLTTMNLDGVSSVLLGVYQRMLEDGTIEKIAREQVSKMIQQTLSDAMSWNGPVKAAFKQRIEPLMIQAIEQSDFADMTVKLEGVINQALNASTVESYREICEGLKSICAAPAFKYGQKLKLSEIFDAYKQSCKHAFSDVYFDKDELEEDEDGHYQVCVCCRIEVNQEKRYFGDGDYTITFTPECGELKDDDDVLIKNTFSVKVHNYQGYGSGGKNRLLWFGALDALTIRKLPEFAVYLQAAKDASCDIDIDMSDDEDEVMIEL